MSGPERDRRARFTRGLRRPPAVHRPARPAPETPEEVLERAPTSEGPMAPYVVGGLVDLEALKAAEEEAPAPPPALTALQIARLEAQTAVWDRQVRLEEPADATILHLAPRPPVPPARLVVAAAAELEPAAELERLAEDLDLEDLELDPAAELDVPAPDPAAVAGRGAELLELELEREALADRAPVRQGPAPARVSDWTSRHDPRSLEYPVRQLLRRPVPLQDVSLDAGPVLDQGTTPPLTLREASACGGMAGVTAANRISRRGPVSWDGDLREEEARTLYHLAQDRDHAHGSDYAGTSVLGIMRAGQELELWESYLWALGGTRDVAQVLLQLGLAVVVGVPWSSGLEEPDARGIIRPTGEPAGGHALAVVGLRQLVGGIPGPWFELQQSRGPAEGVAGRVYLHHRDLARLLAGVGEAAVPLPAGVLELVAP